MSRHFDGGQFITGLFLELDLANGALSCCSAGHPFPLLPRGTRVVKTLQSGRGLPLGVGALGQSPTGGVSDESLEPGDRVLMYSDGVVEETMRKLCRRSSTTSPGCCRTTPPRC